MRKISNLSGLRNLILVNFIKSDKTSFSTWQVLSNEVTKVGLKLINWERIFVPLRYPQSRFSLQVCLRYRFAKAFRFNRG